MGREIWNAKRDEAGLFLPSGGPIIAARNPHATPAKPASLMHELKDTQNERDHRRIAIDRVGVRSLRYPIQVRDKAGTVQSTVATVSLAVDLPHQYKGTHMSRFVEVLNSHGPVLDVHSISEIPKELLARLNALHRQ